MDLHIKVCTNDNCKVIILDETAVGDKGYLSESSTSTIKYRFKYSDTVSIDVLQHNKVDNPEIQLPVFTLHDDANKSVTLPVGFDGWFNVYHIVLPTKEWFDRELAKPVGSAINMYKTVYYSDGIYIYKYFNEAFSTVTVDEIVERNIDDTTISRTYNNYVSICFLNKCYLSLCQQIFNNRGFSKCWSKDTTIAELAYKRDLVWMAINVIKYMVQFNQLAEAERIIEQIGGCNGLCKSEFRKWPERGCGCS